MMADKTLARTYAESLTNVPMTSKMFINFKYALATEIHYCTCDREMRYSKEWAENHKENSICQKCSYFRLPTSGLDDGISLYMITAIKGSDVDVLLYNLALVLGEEQLRALSGHHSAKVLNFLRSTPLQRAIAWMFTQGWKLSELKDGERKED